MNIYFCVVDKDYVIDNEFRVKKNDIFIYEYKTTGNEQKKVHND